MPKDLFFQRSFDFDRSTLNEEERSIDMSLSSETPVPRWFGNEILLHGPENIELDRLDSALINHDPNQIIGRWEEKRIESKQLRAKLFFDDDEEGNRAMRKVKSGSIKGASARYFIKEAKRLFEDEEWNGFKGPAIIATRWQPFEGSLTPIPADYTVGVGRDATRSLDGIRIDRSEKEQKDMTDEEFKKLIDEERERSAKEIMALNAKVDALLAAKTDKLPAMRITPDEYSDLLSRATAVSPAAVVEFAKWAAEGEDARTIERKLFDLATGKPDARDTGGSTPDDTGKPATGSTPGERKFSELDDDALARALKNPSSPL